jgi:Putative Flp pilus-assembly TadE/G-like
VSRHLLSRRLGDEQGGILVLFGLLLPFFLLLGAISVDVGNWYVHKRHLQTQVDAAALAGGGLFGTCFSNPSGGNAAIQDEATKYAGDLPGSLYNTQVGSPIKGTVTILYQSPTFAAGGPGPDDTETQGPCDTPSLMFDVKGTEAQLPLIFRFPGLPWVNAINARARVQLRTVESMRGLLPVAVPDPRFNFAFAEFVDETTGTLLATAELQKAGTSGGLQLWSTPADASVPISTPHVGVRIRLVGGTDPTAGCSQLYVECYDAESANGAVHVRGFDPGAAAPAVRDAWLLPGSCAPDAYFALADCSAGIQADVDLGPLYPLTGTDVSTEVWATVDGGGTYPLTPGATSGTVTTWTLAGGLPLAGGGPHDVGLEWRWEQTSGTWNGLACKSGGNNPCEAERDFGVVQRGFVATPERSGSLQRLQISSGLTSSGANSFAYGTASVGVSIAVTGNLSVQSQATDPVIKLRVVGSQNQSIDCDPAIPNLRDEIAQGCAPYYKLNPSLACPSYPVLWTTPQPWPCVKTQTGGSVGQVSQGLEDRILGGTNSCTAPINWPNYDPDDPRIVPLIITPFGSFSGSGNDVVPVIDFATFYVVGWGGPGGDPCPGAEPVPKGFIAGHFIKYIPPNPTATGTAVCDRNAITPCVAVLTK